jgi:hypothetical protein
MKILAWNYVHSSDVSKKKIFKKIYFSWHVMGSRNQENEFSWNEIKENVIEFSKNLNGIGWDQI